MDWHALLIRHVIAPLWARWEQSNYLLHYRTLRRTQFDKESVIKERQWQRLQALLKHAGTTVPYYRDLFARAQIDCTHVKRDDFQRIPILQKADIQTQADRLLSSKYRKRDLILKRTSGSTGTAISVWIDEESRQWKRACTLRSDEWSGWRLGEPVALVWGNPEYLKRGWRGRFRNALLDRQTYLDTLALTASSLEHFANRLAGRRPSLLFGHAHSIYLLADFIRSHGSPAVRPRGIITTAMILHDWQRRTIEAVFDCPVTNRYGCEEVSLIACECEQHRGLHVNADGVFVELVTNGRSARPGEPGAVIVTDLTNRAMPLIRYRVGDVAAWSVEQCPCGRGLPLLDRLEGREADYVVTRNGTLISGISLTENLALGVPGAAQVQIVQETVSHFRFRLVRGPDFGPASLTRLRHLVDMRLGSDVSFECEYLDRIPCEPSGKYRFCISHVPKTLVAEDTRA